MINLSDSLWESPIFGQNSSFDLKKRTFKIGNQEARCFYLIAYHNSELMERIFTSLQKIQPDTIKPEKGVSFFLENSFLFPYAEIQKETKKIEDEILKGNVVLIIQDFSEAIVLDVRSFQTRSPEEPEKDRTLRGPHIGLNENLFFNIVQIRRYLRTLDLQADRYSLGTKIPNDVALIYLKSKASQKQILAIQKKLENFSLPNLSMTQETLAQYLFPRKKLMLINPFPSVRYTERPDVVAATLMEGKIAILCDNSPSVMLLPECIFDFFEETDDYYFPPITASYLRLVRIFVFLASIFLIPGWLYLVQNANNIPDSFTFILTEEPYAVPLFLQFLIIEIAIDGLRMASLNTPNTLSNSFSVIGGLLLGEFAVKSGWFVPQTILYSAFTGIANFIPTNYELGYSFKFMRISLILFVEFFGGWGLFAGTFLWLLILISTRSAAGKSYLYPFFPFDAKGIMKIFFRTTKGREKEEK